MIADWSGTLVEWKAELSSLKARIGGAFKRSEVREMAGAFIDGLLSGVERKTGWLMAEQAGLDRPYRMQSLLGRGQWSADELRDIVRDYLFETLGDADGVLVVDETGFVKKGEHSAGVARQYSGAAGRFERWLLIRRNRKDPSEFAFISSSHNKEPALLNSPAPPVCVGPSSNVSNGARAISVSTIARCARGLAGIDT